MPIDYLQTDNVTGGNTLAGCSGRTSTGLGSNLRITCTVNGPQGSSGIGAGTLGGNQGTTNQVVSMYLIAPSTNTTWSAGTWTWRFNIVTGNMLVTLTEVHICRLNSSGVNQATIGSSTGLSIGLGTTGLYTGTVTGIAQTPNSGDLVGIFLVATVSGNMGAQFAYYDLSTFITSPFNLQNRLPRSISVGHPFIV